MAAQLAKEKSLSRKPSRPARANKARQVIPSPPSVFLRFGFDSVTLDSKRGRAPFQEPPALKRSLKKMSAEIKPLPKLRRDLTIFVAALILNIIGSILAEKNPDLEQLLNFICIYPTGIVLVILFVGYFVFYPFIHLVNHYEGTSQTAWIVWLVIDTLGVTFGVPRILYFIVEIFPSRREWQSPTERFANRSEQADADKPDPVRS